MLVLAPIRGETRRFNGAFYGAPPARISGRRNVILSEGQEARRRRSLGEIYAPRRKVRAAIFACMWRRVARRARFVPINLLRGLRSYNSEGSADRQKNRRPRALPRMEFLCSSEISARSRGLKPTVIHGNWDNPICEGHILSLFVF